MTDKLQEAKDRLLSRIMGEDVREVEFAQAYAHLVSAETQMMMTKLATKPCDCEGCNPFKEDEFEDA